MRERAENGFFGLGILGRKKEEEFPGQRWEIISFVYRPKEKRWKAISTSFCFPPVPYETLVSEKAKKSLMEVENMETLLFSPEAGRTTGKSRHMIVGIVNHFEEILNALEERETAERLKSRIGLE